MPIVGVTHNGDGSVRIQRSITMKVAIGLPPSEGSNYPKRLDHFVFQRKTKTRVEKTVQTQNGPKGTGKFTEVVSWEVDTEMQEFYGAECKEFWVVFIDDDPDVVFKTEMAWWKKSACYCRGDGEEGHRLIEGKEERDDRRCANTGCGDVGAGKCTPSGDLYFLLSDFPAVGSICKLHTGSWQGIREIRSALEDLRSITGGRLMGVRAKLTVRLENSSYTDNKGQRVSGTKHIVGIELTSGDIKKLTDSLASGLIFDNVQRRLGARAVEVIEDDDEERAADISAEFYPAASITPAPPTPAEATKTAEARSQAKTTTIEQVVTPKTQSVAERNDLEPDDDDPITDDDLPKEMFAEVKEDATPIGGGAKAQRFFLAWSKRKRDPDLVRKYLKEVHQVERNFDIRTDRYNEAMIWATNPIPEAPGEPMSAEETKARNGMNAFSMTLLQQMELIAKHESDWTAIMAELNSMADEENR